MWYTANLLFKRTRDRGPNNKDDILWEESIRLIDAASEEEARSSAKKIGESKPVNFETSDGAVTWTFDRVERVVAIDSESLVNGVELFSRFLRNSEVVSLLTPMEDE